MSTIQISYICVSFVFNIDNLYLHLQHTNLFGQIVMMASLVKAVKKNVIANKGHATM